MSKTNKSKYIKQIDQNYTKMSTSRLKTNEFNTFQNICNKGGMHHLGWKYIRWNIDKNLLTKKWRWMNLENITIRNRVQDKHQRKHKGDAVLWRLENEKETL